MVVGGGREAEGRVEWLDVAVNALHVLESVWLFCVVGRKGREGKGEIRG